MNNYKVYTTGEIIDTITKDKDLLFEAISGIYVGRIVSFYEDMNWLMWNQNNSYEPICINNDFINTMWKVLSPSYIVKIDNYPKCFISEYIKNYCFIN